MARPPRSGNFYLDGRESMELLKLVIVDDEPILLEGLHNTYDWNSMGFEVVGTAQSGEEAIEVIKRVSPHVVLTDIRMKKVTGLMVMEEIQKSGMGCLFIVLSAYRDFEYAQAACDLGAFAYILKPVEDEKLQETMQGAYRTCMDQLKNEAKYESWEKLLLKDDTSFLNVIVQKYARGQIPEEKMAEVFSTISGIFEEGDRFIAVCVGIDLTYKITNLLEYEASRFSMLKYLAEHVQGKYFCWDFEDGEGCHVFIIRAKENDVVKEMKNILEHMKVKEKCETVASISKPYRGIAGIQKCYEEGRKLFDLASMSGASAFTLPEEIDEDSDQAYSGDVEILVINAVRKNDTQKLKESFIHFIYQLPREEELQRHYIHKLMLKAELMIEKSYGMTDELRQKFENYYSNLQNLHASRAVDVCYKILQSVIDARTQDTGKDELKFFKEYMADAVAYIDAHLDDEELSIVSVAACVYLNPVYFGRVFKNTFHMTFKKYLLQQRMEKAKRLLEEGNRSVGAICERVGIGNPSYFSHLFKQYTGKLPSEYRKDYEV